MMTTITTTNTKITMIVLAISAITLSLALSSVVANEAYARQSATITCEQTQSGNTNSGGCSGSSEKSPNKSESCTAKNKGQTSKLC